MKQNVMEVLQRATSTILAIASLTISMGTSVAAEDNIRALAGFPKPLAFTQSFLGFVDEVNRRGEGVVQIEFIGGPEVIPLKQQMDAVRRGVIDMHYGPASTHLGTMAEADAWVGSNITAAEARENGGFALMQDAFAEKLGVKLLAHLDSGIKFHIYTTSEPKLHPDGSLELDGLRLRSQPIYQSFFEALGAIPISVRVPDVYTGLERNTFDGAGWPIVAIQDLSWDRFLKYRIDPGFFATDLAVVISPEKWGDLSDASKALLNEVAVDYEKQSFDSFQAMIAKIDEEVQADGMQIVELEGAAAEAYLSNAFESAWARMREAEVSPHRYYKLRETYYKP